ncbi:major facilitator superfamily domain-containing protein [Lasiosphaeria hispida]|uniref:Major facilitator superfamily domain-containing protein n=1 Tax=Lasiosphaeria hispida TaxID=260671 RepID=A0AAJ0HPH2_9PEZI|nr:major facilitator superfamily domain-containing protein [Lasiosphaeria hispida]
MANVEAEAGAGFQNRGPAVFAVTTATLVLASVFVAARLVSRVGIVRRVTWDDYIIFLAWLFAFALCLSIDIGTNKGLGRHDRDIEIADKPALRMCEYVFSILYNPALMATKTSILVFYLRITKNTQKILRLAAWGVLGIVNVAGTILTFMNIFQCQPVDAAWDVNVRPPIRCIPLLTEFICSAPVNITTDLAIMALPIPVITGMRLPPRQKTILIITFALGFFVTVVDVVRIYYLQQAIAFAPTSASSDPGAMFGQSAGFSWNASLSLMWSAVEVNIGITCACIPTLKPLIIRILPAMIVDPGGTRRANMQARGNPPAPSSSKPSNSDSSQPGTTTTTTDVPPESPQTPQAARVGTRRSSDEFSIRGFLTSTLTDENLGMQNSRQKRASFLPDQPAVGHQRVASMASTVHDRSLYFGFVKMGKPKSMLKTSASESFKYCTIVSILFFLWGVSYGLLNTLNNVVADVADISEAKTLGLTSIYFGGGYFFGPLLVGEWILRHDEHHRSKKREYGDPDSVGGFKTTFIVGLLIYGTGTIMFWPGAVLASYGGFMISSFVVGFGLAVLETAANPFLALCGPPEYADARLLFAQGVQGVGSVLSGLLANNVFFTRIDDGSRVDSTTLLDVQWTYLAVTLLCVLLAFYFYYMPLPEVTDRELDRLASRLPVSPDKKLFGGISLKNWSIILAVSSQWTYFAAQENMSIYFHGLITSFEPPSDSRNYFPPDFPISVLNYLLVAHTVFAASRFFAGILAYLSVKHPKNRFIPTPRTMLTACTSSSLVCIIVAITLKPTSNPNLMAIPIILFFFAEGPIWPLVFSLGLRGQGKRTKRAAAWLTMGGSGPAFWPFVSYAIIKAGGSVQTSFIVAAGLIVVSCFYPVFLTVVKDARALVDPMPFKKGPESGVEDGKGALGRGSGSGAGMGRRGSEAVEVTMDQIIAARRARKEEGSPAAGGLRGFAGRMSWKRSSTGNGEGEVMGTVPESGEGSGQVQQELPPWEGQVLDTRILQD